MSGWDKFNKVVYLMLRLAYVNLLWILFIFVGLVVFGIFPATAAMFSIIRKWQRGEQDFNTFKTFWKQFKMDFLKVNGLGFIFLAFGYFLYFDFNFIMINPNLKLILPALIFLLISFIVTMLFFFQVFVHFKLKFFQYIKQSFLIAITSPTQVLLIGATAVGMFYLIKALPGIILLFSGSLFAYIATIISLRTFTRIEERKGV